MKEGGKVSKTLDLLGFFCPIPIHETKAAIFSLSVQLESDTTWVLEVVCDDPETLRDIPTLCDRMGVNLLEVVENSGEYVFFIDVELNKSRANAHLEIMNSLKPLCEHLVHFGSYPTSETKNY